MEHNLQDSELSKEYRDNFDSAATTGEEGITVWGSGTNPRGIGMGALIHELAHVLDGAQQPLEHNKWVYSNTDEYTKAMADDGNFPSDYAEQSTKVYDGTRQKNAEDFADAVSQYMTDHDNFTKKCPHRSSYLKGIIGD